MAKMFATGLRRKPMGRVMAAATTIERIPVTKNAPNRDHQWPFVSLQLRIRPSVAFEFSIMIAGA
jgi:hypothetical protein